jgi:transcriptional regulator with XRE-family HTH domain
MTLREYLRAENLTLVEFARRVGVHPITVHDWAAGKAIPRRASLARIAAATEGRVTAASFYEVRGAAA